MKPLLHAFGAWVCCALLLVSSAARGQEKLVVTSSVLVEIVVALGGADRLVGVAGGVAHIPEVATLPKLPGFRQTSAEPLLALGPAAVLMIDEFQPPQTLAQLRAAGVRVELFAPESTQAAVEARIERIAALLGKKAEGATLLAQFRRQMDEARRLVATTTARPRVLFILAGGMRPTLVGGRGTGVANLIDLAGARNVADAIEGFKVMSQESMIEAAPEFILSNQEGLDPAGGVPVALKAPGALATPAGQARRLITIPDYLLSGFGIHTPTAIVELARRLHPSLSGAGLPAR